MITLIAGIVVGAITAVSFWMCLPRNGVTHRFVGTPWEAYVGVAFCSAFALSFTMILSGAIGVFGTPSP